MNAYTQTLAQNARQCFIPMNAICVYSGGVELNRFEYEVNISYKSYFSSLLLSLHSAQQQRNPKEEKTHSYFHEKKMKK